MFSALQCFCLCAATLAEMIRGSNEAVLTTLLNETLRCLNVETDTGILKTQIRHSVRFGPKIPVGPKKCMEWGFGYGKSEYEVSFGLAPRNGELSPSVPETPKHFNSPFRDRNPERS